MTTLQIKTPRIFVPLLQPSRYKGAWGGRMGAKSHFFAELSIERHISEPTRQVCIREIQKSISQSVKLLLEDKIKSMGVDSHFNVLQDRIEARNGGFITFQGMQNHTAQSIKSLEGYDIAWCEEAQTLSERSLELLRPTIIRKSGAELWFSWNPDNETDPVDKLLRGANPVGDSIVVKTLYSDNPYLPHEILLEIEKERERDPDTFGHIWLGEYRKFRDGAIYGRHMADMLADNRITSVPYNSSFEVHTIWDIGGDGTAIWFFQVVGREPRLIDHYEEIGTELKDQVKMLKERGYNYGTHVLPHDAGHESVRTGMTMEKQLEGLGLRNMVVLPNDDIDPGIEMTKRLLMQIFIDAKKCAKGIESLKNYQRKWDEERRMFSSKPLHNWASHSSDALRYLAVWFATQYRSPVIARPEIHLGMNFDPSGDIGWMAG